ncbi:MAG: Lrp/AsnC ligand binding domain-containing protein [Deltaproteobacteria bacterium]|nr:Lrp/AsnC ligand binding domain-containing protein [Deltaproteobacteria bacterium]
MVNGYVLLRLVPGLEKEALTTIRLIKGVIEVELVFGHWDAVVKVEAKTINELTRKVMGEIRGVQGIGETETLVATEF